MCQSRHRNDVDSTLISIICRFSYYTSLSRPKLSRNRYYVVDFRHRIDIDVVVFYLLTGFSFVVYNGIVKVVFRICRVLVVCHVELTAYELALQLNVICNFVSTSYFSLGLACSPGPVFLRVQAGEAEGRRHCDCEHRDERDLRARLQGHQGHLRRVRRHGAHDRPGEENARRAHRQVRNGNTDRVRVPGYLFTMNSVYYKSLWFNFFSLSDVRAGPGTTRCWTRPMPRWCRTCPSRPAPLAV